MRLRAIEGDLDRQRPGDAEHRQITCYARRRLTGPLDTGRGKDDPGELLGIEEFLPVSQNLVEIPTLRKRIIGSDRHWIHRHENLGALRLGRVDVEHGIEPAESGRVVRQTEVVDLPGEA